MSVNMADLEGRLDDVVKEVVAPHAREVDEQGRFPRESIAGLSERGLLGLVSSADVGGVGAGLPDACKVVEELAGACGSTAMVTMMHFVGTAVIEAHGPGSVRSDIAAGRHLTTLAFSEAGSRSHFWTPVSTAVADNGQVRLSASKSWVTSAGEADSYVWSSQPVVRRHVG